jgi:opacity protein-like surface antigen
LTRKIGTAALFLSLLFAVTSSLFAQEHRIEASGFLGYSFSRGVPINPVSIGGNTYNRINPTNGFAYGFTFGVFATENFEVEFEWARQDSALEAKGQGGRKRNFTDMSVDHYHGNVVYNFGDEDGPMRPYLFGGVGATQFRPSEVMGQSVDSSTKFSSTWGGGVKLYPGRNLGVKVGARWTPTYIKSEAGGIWCSPYWPWGCYVVADDHYTNQLEFSAGVLFRF